LNIVDKIKTIPNLCHLTGCKTTQIKAAQKELDLDFPDEFIDYVKEFGVISFYGTEWTGLNVEGYLNVVDATKNERKLNKGFPQGFFVLENQAIDGILILVNSKGAVYSYQNGNLPTLICKSMSEYLDICIQKNKG
jgi:hypothetical protein